MQDAPPLNQPRGPGAGPAMALLWAGRLCDICHSVTQGGWLFGLAGHARPPSGGPVPIPVAIPVGAGVCVLAGANDRPGSGGLSAKDGGTPVEVFGSHAAHYLVIDALDLLRERANRASADGSVIYLDDGS